MQKCPPFQNKRRTFGILINQIEGRYQSLLQDGFLRYSGEHNINTLIFSGRSLHSPYPQEEEYNTIYKLAESGRLDGIIIAAGTIGNYVDIREMQDFCSRFAPLPMVSISREIPGISGVFSDNKAAMEEMIIHLIEEHGFKRIAFMKGNKANPEAEELRILRQELDPQGIYLKGSA